MTSTPTLLVTGTLGFIFSNFIRRVKYLKLPYRLVCVDYCKNTNPNNIYETRHNTFYLGDCADEHFIDKVFQIERPDFVIHGAAESHVDQSIASARPFILSNVLGTQVMADASVKYGVKQLLLMGTDEQYGQLTSEQDSSWTESSPQRPRNPYSASKAAAEMIVRAAGETHQLPYRIVRSSNNFGPRQSLRNFIPLTIKSILNKVPMGIYGEGAEMREWMYVNDCCDGILKVMEEGKDGEAYNLGTGYEVSNLEMFQMIANSLGEGHNLLKFVPNRKGHDFRYSVETSKVRSLGWEPQIKLRQGIEMTCSWYKNNSWFLKG